MILIGQQTYAQNLQMEKLNIIAKNYGDSIVVRWAPTGAATWKMASKNGYRVERLALDAQTNNEITDYQLIGNFTPYPIQKAQQMVKTLEKNYRNSMFVAAMQLQHGKASVGANLNISEIIRQSEELENRHSLALFAADMSPLAANGLGLRFVDKNIKKNVKYVYRVFANQNNQTFLLDTPRFLVNPQYLDFTTKPSLVNVKSVQTGVQISWVPVLQNISYSAYYIERSSDQKNYTRLTQTPYLMIKNEVLNNNREILYLDSTAKIGVTYSYKIIGIDGFSDLGEPALSDIITHINVNGPVIPQILALKNLGLGKMEISWKTVVDKTKTNTLSYAITKAQQLTGPYQAVNKTIITPTQFSYIDSLEAGIPAYYRIYAFDKNGNYSTSLYKYVMIPDKTPPQMPTGLNGKIDSLGHIQVSWALGKEKDIKAYRIYSANNPQHTFTPLTQDFVYDTNFNDSTTLKTLTPNMYFKVIAFDYSLNESKESAILKVKRPDIVAPVSPVFTNYLVKDSVIQISWINSSSNDLKQTVLSRINLNTKEIKNLLTITANTMLEKYSDTLFETGTNYQYLLTAKDSSNNISLSKPLSITTQSNSNLLSIKKLSAQVTQNSKTVVLNWENIEGNNMAEIYRTDSLNQQSLVTVVSLNAKTYIDSNLIAGNYSYIIKITSPTGKTLGKSNTAIVNIN